ncbi:discoidin domain-containing protein [Demequina sp.]|uniref:discoidin domain-containing protein n=1 Tax=Demequina sp. TaxID=2050685 RepID=UPI0025B97EF0|nr:discoidin domain-containing protein [Demequina sp.]
MRFRATVATLTALLALAACGPGPEPTSDASATTSATASATAGPGGVVEHRIAVDGGRFIDTDAGDASWTPRGVNYVRVVGGRDRVFAPGVWDTARVDADFASLAADGYNAVRMFLDGCNLGPDCIAEADAPGLNAAYLDNIATATHLASDHGLVLLLTSNDLPDGGPYRTISARDDGSDFPGYRNSDFLTASGHEAMARYWDDLMQGLADAGADFSSVWAWSILNEHWLFEEQPPLSLTSGEVTTATGTYDMADAASKRAMVIDGTRAMIADVRTEILAHDPEALVTMGFFVPNFPTLVNPSRTWYSDTAPLVDSSDLDFFDFHAYFGEGTPVTTYTANFGVTDAKPTVMGEYGGFVHDYFDADTVALDAQRWMAASCPLGWDGWLYWGYERLPLDDATWSFTDASGRLQDALAPVTWTDPCTVNLVDPNLAHGARVFASAELPEHPASAAVDGDFSTRWRSGASAPQWIQVDVGSGTPIGAIELVVEQWPAGHTVHQVEVINAVERREVHRFEGDTADGDVLHVDFPEPLTGVVSVRVTTIESPSWVSWYEVRVLAAD